MPVTIQSPVTGIWTIHSPRGHHPYSKDFRALDYCYRTLSPALRLRHLLGRLDVTALPAWAQPVRAPLGGRIVTVAQDHDDRLMLNLPRDLSRIRHAVRSGNTDAGFHLGNHLILETDDGHHLLLAHLKKSSVRVVPGQTVSPGDVLAKVGNSGLSLLPHLHFHVTDPAAPNPDQPLPFVFETHQRLDGGVWYEQAASLPPDHRPFRIS